MTESKQHRPFDPADYPAYEFLPDGTPNRVVPVTRGKYAGRTGPCTPYVRPSDGIEVFALTRHDGQVRQVSRRMILKVSRTLNPESQTAVGCEDPWADGKRSIDGYPDYVVDSVGNVYRFQSSGRGRYFRLRPVSEVRRGSHLRTDGTVRPVYFYLDSVAGSRDYLTREKIMRLAGFGAQD